MEADNTLLDNNKDSSCNSLCTEDLGDPTTDKSSCVHSEVTDDEVDQATVESGLSKLSSENLMSKIITDFTSKEDDQSLSISPKETSIESEPISSYQPANTVVEDTDTSNPEYCDPAIDCDVQEPEDTGIKKLAGFTSQQTNHIVDLDYLARCQHPTQDVPEVKSFAIALLELVFEKQSDVSSTAMGTIQKMGHKHPATVLRTVLTFLSGENKSSTRTRSLIFTIMEATINPAVELGHLDIDLAKQIMKLTLDELLSQTEPILDIQLPAANVLVSIGAVYCRELIQVLLSKLQPASLPHPSIVSSLASLATTNIYGTVPHLQGILELLLSHIKAGQVKSSVMRANYATALAKFSEALAFYFANKERAPDPSIKPQAFHESIGDAFEIVSSQWLPCKSKLTCQEILEALGQMSQLLPTIRLDPIALKFLPSLIQSYRGPVEPLYVSKALALFLDAFFEAHLHLAEISLHELLQSLFLQATVNPDYSQPSTVKNHYEVLRCIERTARIHPDAVISFLVSKLEQPNEKHRVASLMIIKHLINALKEHMEPYVSMIGAQLKSLTASDNAPNQNNNIKKALVQVIVALAVQGHLLTSDMVHAGRHVHLIAFLLKQCTLSADSDAPPASPTAFETFMHPLQKSPAGSQSTSTTVKNDELRQMSENVIQLLVSTQEPMEDLFWHIMIRLSLDVEYVRAHGVIVRALSYLVSKKSFESCLNVMTSDFPSSSAIIARFLVLARSLDSRDRCLTTLSFLEDYACIVHPSLGRLWKMKIPALKNQVKSNALTQDSWREMLEKFADSTLEQMKISSLEWTLELSAAMFNQIHLYESQAQMRGFLFALVGICVHHGVVKQGPSYAIDFVMSAVRHHEIDESIGCASALGWCSRTHLDVVLLKLQNVERNDFGRKPGGFLGFMRDSRSEFDADMLKSTAARCYARIAIESPPKDLLAKVDKQIVKSVIALLQSTKDTSVRQEGLEAVASIAQCLCQRMQEKFVLNSRTEFLKESLIQLKSVTVVDILPTKATASDAKRLKENSLLAKGALNAISALAQLQPVLCASDQSTLLEASLEKAIALYASLIHLAHEDGFSAQAALTASQLLESIEKLVTQIMRLSLDPGGMDMIFSQLLPWTRGQEEAMRRSSLNLLKLAMTTLSKEVEFQPGAPTRFSQGHLMMSKILPRCIDPEKTVRDLAIDCLCLILEIISMYVGYSSDYEKETVEKLQALKDDLGSADPASSLNVLAGIINYKTPPSDLWSLLESMTIGLSDPFPTSSYGLSLVMCLILKARGNEIQFRNKDLLELLLTRLKTIEHQPTRHSLLDAVCILATHQRETVAQTLLSHSLPYNEDISDCWKTLAADTTQSSEVLDILIETLKHVSPYDERGPHASETIISGRLLSVIAAIKSMCLVYQLRDALLARFAEVFCSLLLAQGCCLGASPPIHFPSGNGETSVSFSPVNREAYKINPYQMAADALKAFLTCTEFTLLMEPLSEHRHWANSGDAIAFSDLISSLASLCALHIPNVLPGIIVYFSAYMKSNYERNRLVSVSFYAELIQRKTDAKDVESIIRGLTMALPDSSPLIRRKVLKGLGALGDCDIRKWKTLAPMVLNTLMDGLEEGGWDQLSDEKASTTKEALDGLMKLMSVIPMVEIERLAPRLALRIRPFFEHNTSTVREAAFSLLSKVFLAGSTTSARDQLSEQVHATLTSLLLHLNELDPDVVRACKSALRHAGLLLQYIDEDGNLQDSAINPMLQTHLPDDGKLNYSAFLVDLVKLIVKDHGELVHSTYLPAATSYFKSSVPELRANAALYVGLLCGTSQPKCNENSMKNVTAEDLLVRMGEKSTDSSRQ